MIATVHKDQFLTVTVRKCQRCNQDHESVTFRPLSNPVDDFCFWSTCPETYEPIHLAILTPEASA